MPSIPSVEVLVVDADGARSELLVRAIQHHGLATDVAGDVVEAQRLLARNTYMVLVLDLMLPDSLSFAELEFVKADVSAPMHIVGMTMPDASLLVHLDRSAVKTVLFQPVDVEQLAAYAQILTASNRG